MDLGRWTAPPDHRAQLERARTTRLSLQRPRPFGASAPTGQDARDLVFYDSVLNHPEHGVTPVGIIAALRTAEGGDPTLQNDLIDGLVEGDCHLRSLFEKREQAVAGKPRVIQAGDDSADGERGAEVMRAAMERLPLVEVFEHLLKYNRHGYAACEIDWGIVRMGGRNWIVPTWFAPVPVRRFRINTGTLGLMNGGGLDELRIVTDYRRPLGDQLRPGKWLILRRSGTALARSGLMRTGVWPAMGKRYGWRDWVIWMDKFGQPVPIASYADEADDASKDVAAEIVRSIGETNGAIKPKSVEVEFAEAGRFGDSGSVHQSMIDYCNAEMSKLVNGSTLTNDNKGSGGASYALGSVHDGVRWEAVQYDAEKLETAFENQVSAAFVAYNDLRCAPQKLKIQVVRDLDPMTRVQVASKYKNELGGDISAQQMAQELGFREPSGTTDKLPGMPVKPATTKPIDKPAAGDA
jgi:phage gp29-like protein